MARVNEPPALGSVGGVDGSALMRELLARKRAILIPTLLAAVAALALVTLTPPRYSGLAKVLLGKPGKLSHQARQSDERPRPHARRCGGAERRRVARHARHRAPGD